MTSLEERKTLIGLIGEATAAGARQARACGVLGLRPYHSALAERRA